MGGFPAVRRCVQDNFILVTQKRIYQYVMVALLIAGSAILLMSCRNKNAESDINLQELITQQSEDLTIISSKNGVLSYRFWTPLLERYELAREPYMEFRKGIKIETYNDSTKQIESTLTANYAIFLEKQELWEAKGNVVGTNAKGQKLETQQLFWNQKTKRIYSNVDSKVTQGSDVIVGTGFESDETFSDFTFRRPQGRVEVDVEPRDSTKNAANTTPGGGSRGRSFMQESRAKTSGKQSVGSQPSPVLPPRQNRIEESPVAGNENKNTSAGNKSQAADSGHESGIRQKPSITPDSQSGSAKQNGQKENEADKPTPREAVQKSRGEDVDTIPPKPRTGGLTPRTPDDTLTKR